MTRRLATALVATALVAALGVAAAADRRIRITNATAATMVSLTASSGGWSGEVLGAPVAPGKGALVTIADESGACVYDFTASFDDGSTRTAPGVDVCELSVYPIK